MTPPMHIKEDPLALDPYSPTFPTTRAPEWDDPEPLGLDPYGPITAVLAAEAEDGDS